MPGLLPDISDLPTFNFRLPGCGRDYFPKLRGLPDEIGPSCGKSGARSGYHGRGTPAAYL
jgi:hypothetical protein